MKAIAYFQNLPATDPQSLQDITAPDPFPATTTCWSKSKPSPSTRWT